MLDSFFGFRRRPSPQFHDDGPGPTARGVGSPERFEKNSFPGSDEELKEKAGKEKKLSADDRRGRRRGSCVSLYALAVRRRRPRPSAPSAPSVRTSRRSPSAVPRFSKTLTPDHGALAADAAKASGEGGEGTPRRGRSTTCSCPTGRADRPRTASPRPGPGPLPAKRFHERRQAGAEGARVKGAARRSSTASPRRRQALAGLLARRRRRASDPWRPGSVAITERGEETTQMEVRKCMSLVGDPEIRFPRRRRAQLLGGHIDLAQLAPEADGHAFPLRVLVHRVLQVVVQNSSPRASVSSPAGRREDDVRPASTRLQRPAADEQATTASFSRSLWSSTPRWTSKAKISAEVCPEPQLQLVQAHANSGRRLGPNTRVHSVRE